MKYFYWYRVNNVEPPPGEMLLGCRPAHRHMRADLQFVHYYVTGDYFTDMQGNVVTLSHWARIPYPPDIDLDERKET